MNRAVIDHNHAGSGDDVKLVWDSNDLGTMTFFVAFCTDGLSATTIKYAVPDAFHIYVAKCQQEVTHYHGIICTAYGYTPVKMEEIINALINRRDTRCSPIWKNYAAALSYIKKQEMDFTVYNDNYRYNVDMAPHGNPYDVYNHQALFYGLNITRVSKYWVSTGMPRYLLNIAVQPQYKQLLEDVRTNFLHDFLMYNTSLSGRVLSITKKPNIREAYDYAQDLARHVFGSSINGIYNAYDGNNFYMDQPIVIADGSTAEGKLVIKQIKSNTDFFVAVCYLVIVTQ